MKEQSNNHHYAVILAGGSGTRLWPISRELYPKQLLALTGNKTLIQETFLRAQSVVPKENIYIVTNKQFTTDILLQLKADGFTRDQLIIEPSQKNTAPAIALASDIIEKKDKDALMIVTPADHLITDAEGFKKSVLDAFERAKEGKLITLGITPDGPSTEYGYIKPTSEIVDGAPTAVECFVEKPPREIAEKYIKEGYLWNAGIFVWSACSFNIELKKYLPEVVHAISLRDANAEEFIEHFSVISPVSIDVGLLERSREVEVIKVDFGWRDIGSWKSLYDLLDKDTSGNVLNEHALTIDCENSLVYGNSKRATVAIGITGIVVVDTEDAVLVVHKDETHKIKNAYAELKERNKMQYKEHKTVIRPWGSYTVLEEGLGYKVKKIVVNPHEQLSLQLHHKRSEHWVVIQGIAKATVGENVLLYNEHQTVDIPVETIHRLENPTNEILEIIEVQSGGYLGEDDIVRIEDKHDRIW